MKRHLGTATLVVLVVAMSVVSTGSGRAAAVEEPPRHGDPFTVMNRAGDAIREQAQLLVRIANARNFDRRLAVEKRDELRKEFTAASGARQAFAAALDEPQRDRIEDHIRKLDAILKSLHGGLTLLDTEFHRAAPDPARVSEEAREMEKAMKEWAKQCRKISQELGIGD